MTKLFNGNHLDLYSINSDFTGSRYFTIDQEEVEFHNATTIRIWFNEQSADFRFPLAYRHGNSDAG